MVKPTGNRGVYLYAIALARDGQDLGILGIEGARVYGLTSRGISAFVSDVSGRLRPERRQLAAHQEVLRQVMDGMDRTGAVLPVAFGVVGEGPEAIRRILARNRVALLDNLRRVRGSVEMGLHVGWDVPNIFQFFVDTNSELREARDRLFGRQREPTQDDKIELGHMFDSLLAEERARLTERVVEKLNPACAEIRESRLRNERAVANLACLVERETLKDFESAIFEAAKLFDNNYSFDYNGPWAPHSFVDVALDLDAPKTGEA